jgi:hypothetical protein
MRSLNPVGLHVIVSSIKILSVTQKCVYGIVMWPANTYSCKVADIFCMILNKLGISGQIFIKIANIKFHGRQSTGSCADTPGQTNRPT